MESNCIQNSVHESSGVSGVLSQESQLDRSFIDSLQLSDCRQSVGYGELEQTYIPCLSTFPLTSLAAVPAHLFDAFIDPCFGSMSNVDRQKWPLALRWRSVNEAMSEERRQKNQPYIQREKIAAGGFLLRVLLPRDEELSVNGKKNTAA